MAGETWDTDLAKQLNKLPSAETVRAIIQVLLKHRLHSELTNNDFDVASASPVG